VGALVRAPGVAWGVNWPDGFTIHHPDEYTHVANADAIISPLTPGSGQPYPKAIAAYAAAPYLLWYAAQGSFGGPRVHIPYTVGAGRLVSLAFGVATILLVYLIGRDALRDERAGLLAAWLLAFGGLHVTQSHFFLADVPAVTWLVLTSWLLWMDLTRSPAGDHEALRWAAFAAGAAFAFKLLVFAWPALVYAVVVRGPRLVRAVHAAIFIAAGIAVSSLGFETPASFYLAATTGVTVPFEFDRAMAALLYAIQLPSVLSLPLLVLAAGGTVGLLARLFRAESSTRRHAAMIFGSIPLIGIAFVLFTLDPFPRHLIVLIPWAALAGGWCLSRAITWVEARGRSRWLLLAPVFVWMLAFVVDGERFFIFEPRNDALRWLRAEVPPGTSVNWVGRRTPAGFTPLRWQAEGDPDILVVEMHEMNLALSGVNWRDSYPSNPREVFDGQSAERVAQRQALFRGTSAYVEVARFSENYVMPEYRLAMRLLGDRSRSYITEVVIFGHRRAGFLPPVEDSR
jgi:hypothetical protein